jgi:hypothetical protein
MLTFAAKSVRDDEPCYKKNYMMKPKLFPKLFISLTQWCSGYGLYFFDEKKKNFDRLNQLFGQLKKSLVD